MKLLIDYSIKDSMNTKDKIYRSALKIFVKDGFSATTASITNDAGLSSGILFHYFSTKNSLIIDLYATILLEYYQESVQLFDQTPENDFDGYKKIAREMWDKLISWGLDNWQKFQYMQLFEGSLLADQFIIEDNKEIECLRNKMDEYGRFGIRNKYFKDLPPDYLTKITQTAIIFIIKYLYEHPHYRNDKEMMNKFWNVHLGLLVR